MAELRAYNPSWRDYAGQGLRALGMPRSSVQGLVGSAGQGESGPLMGGGLVDMTPLGIPFWINEAFRARGTPEGTLRAMEFVPGAKPLGKALGKGAKAVAGAADDVVRAVRPDALVVHHNMKPSGLSVASEMGGVPMPSLAVSRVDHPLTNFGGITLLGDPSMAKPAARNQVWVGDAYTGRQPPAKTVFADARSALKQMNDDPIFGGIRHPATLVDMVGDFDRADDAVKSIRAAVNRGLVNPKEFDDVWELKNAAERALEYKVPTDGTRGLSEYGDVQRVLEQGFTPSGNRKKPKPYTLDNVLREMRREGAGNKGSENWNYGPSSFRASALRGLRSMSDVKAARGRVLSESETEKVFDKFSEKFNELVGRVAGQNTQSGNSFGKFDTAAEYMSDLVRGKGREWAGVDWVDNLPDAIRDEIMELAEEARRLPANYMEVKPQRAVSLGEFKGAIIPKDAPPEIAEQLRRAGVGDIQEYADEAERLRLFKSRPDLLFTGLLGTGAAGYGLLGNQPTAQAGGLQHMTGGGF